MSVQIKIVLSPEAQKIVADLQTLPSRALEAIAAAMFRENQLTVATIKSDYLSFPRGGPTTPLGLRKMSTPGYESTLNSPKPEIAGQTIISGIGTPMKSRGVSYPAVHEFGADIPSRPTRSKNKYYAKKHPTTKAYSLGARAPIQHGIADRMPNYTGTISAAIISACKNEGSKN
jgi:hypothetical protein